MKRILALLLAAAILLTFASCGNSTPTDISLLDEVTPSVDLGLSVGDKLTEAYKGVTNGNPISSTIFFADPTSVEYEGRLYVYGTNDQKQYDHTMGFEENSYGVINELVCYSTDDLVNWRYETTIKTSEVCTWAGLSWAPSIVSREEGGKTHFYLYFCNGAGGVGVMTSTSPTGPWKDPIGKALVDGNNFKDDPVFWCFDPGVVIDDDGVGWLAIGGGDPVHSDESSKHTGNCRLVKLGKDMTSLASDFVKVPTYYHFEANELNYINGTYVLTYCSNFASREPWPIAMGPQIQTCSMVYMTTKTPLDADSWEWGGEYLTNPATFGFDFSNNHSHMHKYNGKYYVLYQNVSLLMAMGKQGGYRSINIDEVQVDEENVVIHPATMTKEGPAALKNQLATDVHQAEESAVSAGIKYYSDNGRTYVTKIDDGDWTLLRNVDFGDGVNTFAATVKGKGIIEVRLDSSDGKCVGSIQFDNDSFAVVSGELTKNISGVHDLYLVFGGNFIFDNYQFANVID